MTEQQSNGATAIRLDALADEIYADLAWRFPVCLASDEFHFFPHYRAARQDWSRWDDFSDSSIQACLANISQWQSRVERLTPRRPSPTVASDLDLLTRTLITLYEQLRYVRPYRTQPTLYLTIVSIGLAEGLEHSRTFAARTRRRSLQHAPLASAQGRRLLYPAPGSSNLAAGYDATDGP